MNTYFSTTDNLKSFIDNPDNESYLNHCFSELYEIDLDGLSECPYWIEPYYMQAEDYQVQYIDGYWEPRRIGEVITIDGVNYLYVDSQPLPEEIEHQADDGGLVYEYRGYSYLRILKPIS